MLQAEFGNRTMVKTPRSLLFLAAGLECCSDGERECEEERTNKRQPSQEIYRQVVCLTTYQNKGCDIVNHFSENLSDGEMQFAVIVCEHHSAIPPSHWHYSYFVPAIFAKNFR